VTAQGLPHDAFHAKKDAFGGPDAVVHGEFDKDQIRIVIQDFAFDTEYTEIGAGAGNGGIDSWI